MRQIERTGQFKRDYKREAKGQHRATLDADLVPVLVALAGDQSLEPRHRDHALTGDWKDHRDCHVKPDLVLIYIHIWSGDMKSMLADPNLIRKADVLEYKKQDDERRSASLDELAELGQEHDMGYNQ